MLGSVADAEDALQDTLLAAWQGLGAFEGRASLRTWLYKIATNRCLNARRAASRRPAREWDIPGVQPPEPTRLGEVAWLEPFPDTLLEDATGPPPPSCAPPGVPAPAGGPPCWTPRANRPPAPSGGPAPACPTGRPRTPAASRLRPPAHPPRRRSWRGSPARGSPPIWTRWWPC